MPLTNLKNKIRAIQVFDIEKETIDIINKFGWYITGLVRLQMQQGLDSEDQPVKIFGRDYYSDRTVFDKEHGNYPPLGKVTQFITNYRTGEFYGSLKTTAKGTVFSTQSNVPYFEDIIKRSSDKIIKLNKIHLAEFTREILIPQLRLRYKALQGGI